MWLSFWIAVVIGLVAAIPIWNHPEFENFWAVVGAVASAAQSGLLQVIFAPKTTVERTCYDGPIVLCNEVPIKETVSDHFMQEWPQYISGIFIDVLASVATGVILIMIMLLFVGGEAAKKKRQEIFW